MKLFYHSSGHDFSVVQCAECGDPLNAVYDPEIRDTCAPCGGHSKVDHDEMRQEMRAEYLAKVRESKRS